MDWSIVIGTVVVVVGGGLAMTLWWRRLSGVDAGGTRSDGRAPRTGGTSAGGNSIRVVTIKRPDAAGESTEAGRGAQDR